MTTQTTEPRVVQFALSGTGSSLEGWILYDDGALFSRKPDTGEWDQIQLPRRTT